MTPKEKASELIDKFIKDGLLDKYMGISSAKQCALIAVDEILDIPVCWYSKELSEKNDEECPISATEEFWQQVKLEIEKL